MVAFVCLRQFCTAACLHVAWKWRNLWVGAHNKELFKFLKTIFLLSCTFEIEVLIKPTLASLLNHRDIEKEKCGVAFVAYQPTAPYFK